MKKTGIKLFIIIAGIVFLAACRENTPVSVMPTTTPKAPSTVTATVEPTSEPTNTPVNTPTQLPEVSITTMPEITEVPEIEPTITPSTAVTPNPTPTEPPEVTLTPSPTVSPTVSPSPTTTPSPSPTVRPTVSPTPTESPEVTLTPSPSPSPTATPSPTPTTDPVPLVANGWQAAADITQQYLVVFPECFKDSTTSRTNNELAVKYTSEEHTEIDFVVNYRMQYSYEEAMEEISGQGGRIEEEFLSERRFSYILEDDIMIYQGIAIETQYPKALLGDSFGEEEYITGIMQVVFSYPKERRTEYEQEAFRYFVVSVP